MTAFLEFADRHPLMATLWVFAATFPLCCRPFTLATFVRHVYERVDEKDTGSEE